MAKKPFKCSKCGKSFSMAAHLGRHMSTIHASPKKKAAAKKKRAAASRKRSVKKAANGRRRKRTTSTRGLSNLSVEALSQLIADARAELRQRMTDIRRTIQ